jgi:hypothetical protein
MDKKEATQVGCQTCKKGLSGTQQSLMVLGFYILFASIIGTISIFKYLSSLF